MFTINNISKIIYTDNRNYIYEFIATILIICPSVKENWEQLQKACLIYVLINLATYDVSFFTAKNAI